MTKLNGLSEKIFIDRYALKNNNGRDAKVGDTVMALTGDEQKAVGEVIAVGPDTARIKLRDGNEIDAEYGKFVIALETEPERMWDRLADAIAEVEVPEKFLYWREKFRDLLNDWKLVPGGRIAAGAGTDSDLTFMNCFVIPSPKDSRGGIMHSLTEMTEVMSRGGGVGINLSSLRPKRALVKGVNGTSSGSVSWGGLFSYGTGLIEQGGSRRGALMLMLNDWHPDLFDFITVKQTAGQITNANLSIAVSNAFMQAVKDDGDWTLRFPDTTHEAYDSEWDGNLAEWEAKGYPIKPYKTVKACDIWNLIIESAWKSAEPGVVFMEKYNDLSNSWYFNPIICTNPCGEQGLPGWGVCNLSALNLSKFVANGTVLWDELADATRTATRFLDNVIDATPYHFEENRANQMNERRIGLGTMGLAEMLIKLGIRYGSAESLDFLDELYRFIAKHSYETSINIAEEKGAFPAFDEEKYVVNYSTDYCNFTFAGGLIASGVVSEVHREKFWTTGIRNVTLLTQAPTGSTGTMVGTSTGIEPFYAFEFYRQSRLGTDKQYVPIAQEWLDAHPGEQLPDYFVSAMDLSAEDHVRVQAAIQKWVDSSISKTANAPHDFTVEDTRKLYELAFDLGCKGVTTYRDGSRDVQVLTVEKKAEEPVEDAKPTATFTKRPKRLRGQTIKTPTPFGKAYVTINENEAGDIEEIFVKLGKTGADIGVIADGLAIALTGALSPRLASLTPAEKVAWIVKKFRRMSGATTVGFGPNRVESLPDAIAKVLEEYAVDQFVEHTGYHPSELVEPPKVFEEMSATKTQSLDLCPSCGAATLVKAEGCHNCVNCGYSKCS